MIEHCYSVGRKAPDILNIVVEIPATDVMAQKQEIDLSDGAVIDAGEINPPIPIYWHYGCIPQTLDDEGEALDIIVMQDGADVQMGSKLEVRPIGVTRVMDGWETRDDKIIAVRTTEQHAFIHEIDDLPPVMTIDGKHAPFKDVVNNFYLRYRVHDKMTHLGWGNSRDARELIENTLKKYRCVPLSKASNSAHIFPLYQHIFIPPPPRNYRNTIFVAEVEQVQNLYKK